MRILLSFKNLKLRRRKHYFLLPICQKSLELFFFVLSVFTQIIRPYYENKLKL